MTLSVRDCSPFVPRPSPADEAWLSRLCRATSGKELILRLEEGREDEPVVMCDPDGSWRAGRYVGSLSFEGRRLDILPRFGEETLRSWIAGAFNLVLAETPGRLEGDESFVARLLAAVWTRAFVSTARHGPPSLRSDVRDVGLTVRGKIDLPASVALWAAGRPGVASIRRERSLDHAVTAAIVAAWGELSKTLGRGGDWLPDRLSELIPRMTAAVGPRPRIPSLAEIEAVRLTPITAGFRPLAELSARIASGRGLSPLSSEDGSCRGVLLDVAELWELFVLGALRGAWPDLDVLHGTRELGATLPLLRNAGGRELGTMRPDAVARNISGVAFVADAKYKRLHPTAWNPAPQREDLYQMAAYVGRWGAPGLLIYPEDPGMPGDPTAASGSPWFLGGGESISFVSLPARLDDASARLAGLRRAKAER